MVVTAIFNETHDVKTLRLANPDGQKTIPFDFEPGQFVTFALNIDGLKSQLSAHTPLHHRPLNSITLKLR